MTDDCIPHQEEIPPSFAERIADLKAALQELPNRTMEEIRTKKQLVMTAVAFEKIAAMGIEKTPDDTIALSPNSVSTFRRARRDAFSDDDVRALLDWIDGNHQEQDPRLSDDLLKIVQVMQSRTNSEVMYRW